MRVANLEDASEHIGEVLRRVKKQHLQRAYKIQEWYNFFFSNKFVLFYLAYLSLYIIMPMHIVPISNLILDNIFLRVLL